MIRLRHKLLIQMFRLLDQMILIFDGRRDHVFPPGNLMRGWQSYSASDSPNRGCVGMLILAIGWIVIFDYFIRYKSDRLVALNTQIKNLLKATSLASFWLMIVCAVFWLKNFNLLNILIFFLVVTCDRHREQAVCSALTVAECQALGIQLPFSVGHRGERAGVRGSAEDRVPSRSSVTRLWVSSRRIRDGAGAMERAGTTRIGKFSGFSAICVRS